MRRSTVVFLTSRVPKMKENLFAIVFNRSSVVFEDGGDISVRESALGILNESVNKSELGIEKNRVQQSTSWSCQQRRHRQRRA